MLNSEFLIDESLFGIPQVFQKYMKLTKHPNFRKKFVEPGVLTVLQVAKILIGSKFTINVKMYFQKSLITQK